ncbi:hypothetical protein HY967_00830 [Candidatus Jorgensenbacteria bacterium]|nr:hypothetical protein [Candidatus Jorgensenbacteria bacterium]
MVEAIVAIMIAIVGLFGIIQLLTRSLALTREKSDEFTAIYLAAEGIEIVKNLIDVNYTTQPPGTRVWNEGITDGSYEFEYFAFFDSDPNPDLQLCRWRIGSGVCPQSSSNATSTNELEFYVASNVYRYRTSGGGVLRTPFRRTIRIQNRQDSNGDDYKMEVRSIVEWTKNSQNRKVELEDSFFNWRQ